MSIILPPYAPVCMCHEGDFWCRSVFSQTFSCSGHVYRPQNCGMSIALRRGRWAEGSTAEDCWARPCSVCRMEAKRCVTGRQRRASGIYDGTQGVGLGWVSAPPGGRGSGSRQPSPPATTGPVAPECPASRPAGLLTVTPPSPSERETPPCLCVSWEGRTILLPGTAWSCSPSSHACTLWGQPEGRFPGTRAGGHTGGAVRERETEKEGGRERVCVVSGHDTDEQKAGIGTKSTW